MNKYKVFCKDNISNSKYFFSIIKQKNVDEGGEKEANEITL